MAVEPLLASAADLQRHFSAVARVLNKAVDVSAIARLGFSPDTDPAIAGLEGEGCELVARNRGGRTQVAPLVELERELWAWLGYREEWAHEPGRGGRRYSFRSLSLTIHFGARGDLFKPQMFRAEWSGWARWGIDNRYGFQAGDAGHPHWQFDALDSLTDQEAMDRAVQLRQEIRSGPREGPREFGAPRPESDMRDIVTSKPLSRVHFASAAAWWKPPPQNGHAHQPARLFDLEVWVDHALSYMRVELGRLQAA